MFTIQWHCTAILVNWNDNFNLNKVVLAICPPNYQYNVMYILDWQAVFSFSVQKKLSTATYIPICILLNHEALANTQSYFTYDNENFWCQCEMLYKSQSPVGSLWWAWTAGLKGTWSGPYGSGSRGEFPFPPCRTNGTCKQSKQTSPCEKQKYPWKRQRCNKSGWNPTWLVIIQIILFRLIAQIVCGFVLLILNPPVANCYLSSSTI